jgi:hypothetical protein
MKRNKPFKIDLGLGDLFGHKNYPRVRPEPVRVPTYTGQKYAVFTQRDGVTIKHTFKNSTKARAFLETARGSGSYDVTSRVLLDF